MVGHGLRGGVAGSRPLAQELTPHSGRSVLVTTLKYFLISKIQAYKTIIRATQIFFQYLYNGRKCPDSVLLPLKNMKIYLFTSLFLHFTFF